MRKPLTSNDVLWTRHGNNKLKPHNVRDFKMKVNTKITTIVKFC